MSLAPRLRNVLPMLKSTIALGAARARGRRLPCSITFILTHRCNFQCDYCDIPAAAGAEMSQAEFCGAIDELAAAGMARASFSGGEVLIRPDALAILGHAKSRGMFTSLNSNGWLVERHIDALAGALDMLVVSIDGPEPTHDLVRKKRGSYTRVLRAIDLARARGIAVATITVLSRSNLHVVDDVLALAEQHGFWAYFQPAYSDCFNHGRGLDPALGPDVLATLARDLGRARAAGRPIAASPGFLERLGNGPAFGDCGACHAGRYFGTVMPDGTVVPCHLVSQEASYPNGREIGFARAFLEMPHPTSGPGCAISPYQESDLIFSLDPRAIRSAFERVLRTPGA
jgi:MoaA/NifB/PqqE/SkfB family radical SAM enzyme